MKWLYGLLLSVLGFSGCNKDNDDINGGGLCMYGTPTVTFELKGKVVDKESKGISGIVVKLLYEDMQFGLDTTDVKGLYEVKSYTTSFGHNTIKYQLSVEDVDGVENGGSFLKDTVDILVSSSDIKGGDGAWNVGTVTKTLDIEMKKADE